MLRLNRPTPAEYNPYFEAYISLVGDDNVIQVMRDQIDEMRQLLAKFDATKLDSVDPPYTWSPKQVLGHCIDTERIMGYRVAMIAASDTVDLPGFDQNELVDNSDFNSVAVTDLLDEFQWCRQSNLSLFARLPDQAWTSMGKAHGNEISVGALVYMMAGHVEHHRRILVKRC